MLMMIDLDSASEKIAHVNLRRFSSGFNHPKSTLCKIDQMDNQSVFVAFNISLRFTLDKRQKQQ